MKPEGSAPPSPARRPSPLAAEWAPGLSNRPIMPGPLRLRLALPFVLLFVTILLLLSVFLGSRARDVYVDRLTDELSMQAAILADSVGRGLANGATPDDIQALVLALPADVTTRVTIIGPDGDVYADNVSDPQAMENHANRPEIVRALARGEGESSRESATLDQAFLYVAVPIAEVDGAVARVAVPTDEVLATVQTVRLWIVVAAAAAIAMVVAIAWFIAGRIVGPLEELRQQAHAVAAGDLSAAIGGRPGPAGRRRGDHGRRGPGAAHEYGGGDAAGGARGERGRQAVRAGRP